MPSSVSVSEVLTQQSATAPAVRIPALRLVSALGAGVGGGVSFCIFSFNQSGKRKEEAYGLRI
jgi:hypothetical protein